VICFFNPDNSDFMKNYFITAIFTVLLAMFIIPTGFAQYSTKKVKTKHEQYTDSLKNVQYDYIFPIWGQKVYKKGFDIPYPVGFMANSIWMKQDLIFSNFQLGFQNDNVDIPLTDADFIQFGQNTNKSQNYTIRPDVWVFPFLNVYGLFGAGSSTTNVNLITPIDLNTEVVQDFSTKGFGMMLAGGVGPVWISADFNWTWNKPKLLDEPVKVSIIGLRVGHTFVFKQKPERNIALWVGGMRAEMASETSGQITLNEALPSDVWDKKDAIVDEYWTWYDGLNPLNPVDRKIIEAADKVLTPIVEAIDNKDGSGTVKYAMDKQTKQLWNGLVGAQFQLNKHWQFRTEAGLVGNRKSFLFSANYRILL